MLNFIVNMGSGKGRGAKTLKKLIAYCYKNRLDYTVHITGSKGHATRIAKALCENNSHTIIAVGGDGTFHETLNGITTPDKTVLGFIPAGRGNDYAKGAGIPLDPIRALKKILENRVRCVDYIDVNGQRCLNVCGTGLDIDVLQRVDGKTGKITYLKSLIYCLFHFEPYKVMYTLDGVKNYRECIMIGVCNGTQFGGGMKLSPESKIDDGKMNVVILTMLKDRKILKVLPKFTKGKHLNEPFCEHFLCDEISITSENGHPIQLDGEIYDNLPFNCKLVKGGIKTFEM